MVPSHHPVHFGSCFSHGLANTESGADARDRRKRGKRRKKKMETLTATLPLSELECVQTHAGAGLPVMVALSAPEIRQLYYYLVWSSPLSARFLLPRSFFRRPHQAIARSCHYNRRLACAYS